MTEGAEVTSSTYNYTDAHYPYGLTFISNYTSGDYSYNQDYVIVCDVEWEYGYKGTLFVIDVTDRNNMTTISKFNYGDDNSFYIDVEYIPGTNCLVAVGVNKAEIINFTDPSNLEFKIELKDSSGGAVQAHNAYVHGSLLILAGLYDYGAYIYDISDPTAPDLLLYLTDGSYSTYNDLAIIGDYIFASYGGYDYGTSSYYQEVVCFYVSGLNDHATTPITAPIILDLNNDGFIFESINDSKVYFDVDKDGYKEKISWINSEDGVLVYDKNLDHKVSDVSEFAFTEYVDGAKTDLEGLVFDSNNDGD